MIPRDFLFIPWVSELIPQTFTTIPRSSQLIPPSSPFVRFLPPIFKKTKERGHASLFCYADVENIYFL
jgi:hypothetical protein